MPLDFRDDSSDLYRIVLVILRTGLFTGHMFRILVILVTNIFPNLLTWGEISHLLYFPRLRKGSGVFVGSLEFEVPQVRAADPCGHLQLFGVRKAAGRPSLIVKTDRVNNQRVALPLAGRVTEPCRVQACRMIAVQKNLAESGGITLAYNY